MTWFVVLLAVWFRNWTLLKVMLSVQAIRFLFVVRLAWIEVLKEELEEELEWLADAPRRETQQELLEAAKGYRESLEGMKQ